MSAKSVKPGERVRVVLEGEVGENRFGSFTVGSDAVSTISHHRTGGLVSVEVLPPPVEYFKPGDRLKRKWPDGAFEITLADSGYLQHFTSGDVEFYEYGTGEGRAIFNSDDYELVTR